MLNSFVVDFVLRQKASGGNLNFYVFKQLPIIDPRKFNEPCAWNTSTTFASWISARVLELTYVAWDLKGFAKHCGYDGPPFIWDEERRYLLRSELDAALFHLFLGAESEWKDAPEETRKLFQGPRMAVEHIMEKFPIVKRWDVEEYGEYRTKGTILDIYDDMSQAIGTGHAYQTCLAPPPGPPSDAEGNFIPMAEYHLNKWPSHIHPPRKENEMMS
jgi:hypothetical protein